MKKLASNINTITRSKIKAVQTAVVVSKRAAMKKSSEMLEEAMDGIKEGTAKGIMTAGVVAIVVPGGLPLIAGAVIAVTGKGMLDKNRERILNREKQKQEKSQAALSKIHNLNSSEQKLKKKKFFTK